jgi:alpha-1,6-mannosyltransferase
MTRGAPLAVRTSGWALTRREALAAATLAGMVATGAKLAFDAAAEPSRPLVFSLSSRGFPGWLSGPFHGLGAHLTWASFYAEILVLCALWVAALVLADSIRLRWAMAAVVSLHLLLMLAPPIGLSDAFNYIAYGRLAVEHGLNPYTDTLVSVPDDSVFVYATWPDWTNPYGPLATLAFHPLGLLGVPQALWLVKIAAATCGIGLAWLVAVCARELRRPAGGAVVLVALNPVLLVYAVAGAHIDLLLMVLVVAGVLALLRARERAAGAAIAAAAGVKATGALILPFALAGARGRRRDLWVGAGVTAAALVALGLVLWGPHLLAGVADQRDVSSARSLPGILARAFGAHDPPVFLQAFAGASFAAAYAWLVRAAWRGEMDWLVAAGWATVAMLLAVTWLMPWYVVWLLPFAALAGSRRLQWASVALTLFVVLVRLIPLG